MEQNNTKLPALRRKKVVVEVKRDLNRLKFSPTAILVNQVFPQLDPKDQAKVCLELISYLFPKPAVNQKQKATKVTVTNNNQIANNPITSKSTGLTPSQFALLEKIASDPE